MTITTRLYLTLWVKFFNRVRDENETHIHTHVYTPHTRVWREGKKEERKELRYNKTMWPVKRRLKVSRQGTNTINDSEISKPKVLMRFPLSNKGESLVQTFDTWTVGHFSLQTQYWYDRFLLVLSNINTPRNTQSGTRLLVHTLSRLTLTRKNSYSFLRLPWIIERIVVYPKFMSRP